MYILRAATASDFKQVLTLSRLLNQINLSTESAELQKQIQKSTEAFEGELFNKFEADYIFCLEDIESKRVVGTSMIMAQHGTKESPHYYFQVIKVEKFSKSIHSGIVHEVLRLGYDMDGPTEVGGLVLDPAFRKSAQGAGRMLSLGRFMYMSMHRRRFKDRVIAEFLPPFTPDGKSFLWEAIGRKFTNLPYLEADKISRKHKEFIQSLFPKQDLFISLLDAKTRAIIGEVGEETLPAIKMLQDIGFKYLNMVDPFDGGPHYGARMKDLTIMKNAKFYKFKKSRTRVFNEYGFVASGSGLEFRTTLTNFQTSGKYISLPSETEEALRLEPGSNTKVFKMPPRKKISKR